MDHSGMKLNSVKRKRNDDNQDSERVVTSEMKSELQEQKTTQQTPLSRPKDLTAFSPSTHCLRRVDSHDNDRNLHSQHHFVQEDRKQRKDDIQPEHQHILPPSSAPAHPTKNFPHPVPPKPSLSSQTQDLYLLPWKMDAHNVSYPPTAEHMFHAFNSMNLHMRSKPLLSLKSVSEKQTLSDSSNSASFREQLKRMSDSSTATRPSVVLTSDRGWTLNISAPLGAGTYADVWKGSLEYDAGWDRETEEVAVKRLIRDNVAPGDISKEYLFSAYLCQVYGKKTPVCEPKFLLDRVEVSSILESLLVMEIASCSLSSYFHAHFEGLSATYNEDQNASLHSIYLAFIEAAYLVNAAGIHHRDLHTGNVLLRIRDKDGNICHGTQHLVVPLDLGSSNFDVLICDFGLSEFFCTSGSAFESSVIFRGAEAYMAPDCFQNSDGWSVLFIGYWLAGVRLPWDLKGKGGRPVLSLEVERIKMRCLFGERWLCSISNLKAIITDEDSKSITQWRRDAQRDANLWFEAFELDGLFKALLEVELQFLQTGKLVPWTDAASRWRNKVLRNGINTRKK
jgi:hypothetical protein